MIVYVNKIGTMNGTSRRLFIKRMSAAGAGLVLTIAGEKVSFAVWQAVLLGVGRRLLMPAMKFAVTTAAAWVANKALDAWFENRKDLRRISGDEEYVLGQNASQSIKQLHVECDDCNNLNIVEGWEEVHYSRDKKVVEGAYDCGECNRTQNLEILPKEFVLGSKEAFELSALHYRKTNFLGDAMPERMEIVCAKDNRTVIYSRHRAGKEAVLRELSKGDGLTYIGRVVEKPDWIRAIDPAPTGKNQIVFARAGDFYTQSEGEALKDS